MGVHDNVNDSVVIDVAVKFCGGIVGPACTEHSSPYKEI